MGTESADSRVDASSRDLFQVSRDPILVVDLATLSVVDANDAAVELLGYERSALVDRRVTDLVPSGVETAGADLGTELTEGVGTGDQSGGTGFGLYFVHSMVSVYGGEVSLGDSERGGTTVTVELPAA